jgi:rifampicin phosphotransferase
VVLGSKAANLARARGHGLPVVDGFVIAPELAAAVVDEHRSGGASALGTLRSAWRSLSRNGSEPIVVRSSSAAEDTETSSQAGVFESVVDVHGWDEFIEALRTVVGSAARAPSGDAALPLAVLVQRHVDPALSGVLFTLDPVTGRPDRIVVAVVEGGPQALVSGAVAGTRVVLDRRARLVEGSRRGCPLRWRHRTALVRLARRAEALFGSPQDIEWAIDRDGRLLLLQSRPITTSSSPLTGPTFGPGPVAETFPEPLRPLEQDLWLDPLRDALRLALGLTGAAGSRALGRSPVLIHVGGRAAVDLDLLGAGGRTRRRGLALLDPRAPARRLRVAWQVGRLRGGLPSLSRDLIDQLDRELAAVPPPGGLTDEQLVQLLERCSSSLRAAHGYELLAGMLSTDQGPSGVAVALAALDQGRSAGLADADIVATAPAVLALTAPAIGPEPRLAATSGPAGDRLPTADPAALEPREALRLRLRWLHELSARAAWTLGQRLAASGRLSGPDAVAHTRLADLARAVRSGAPIEPVAGGHAGPPLPARFRLAEDGTVVAVPAPDRRSEGTAAGGGRASGVASHADDPAPGSVLVVDVLDPRLAPVLPRLAALVAATGSPLSHLAILAREHGVPTVVDVPDARRRYPVGAEVLVDGTTGEVRVLEPAGLPREGVT